MPSLPALASALLYSEQNFKGGTPPGTSLEGETKISMEPQVGSILEGKVTSIVKFGAFVALDNGKSGLVHISEIANSFVNDVHDFLEKLRAAGAVLEGAP